MDLTTIRGRNAEIVRAHDSLNKTFTDIARNLGISVTSVEAGYWSERKRQRLLSEGADIIALNLPKRFENALIRAGVRSIEQAREIAQQEVLDIRNFGMLAQEALRNAIREFDS